MVKMLDFEGFIASMGNFMIKPQMNMSVYSGGKFECACGEYHQYDYSIKILAEGSKMRVVMECPKDHNFLTNVSIKHKGFFPRSFDKFETISGTKLSSDVDRFSTLYAFNKLR